MGGGDACFSDVGGEREEVGDGVGMCMGLICLRERMEIWRI